MSLGLRDAGAPLHSEQPIARFSRWWVRGGGGGPGRRRLASQLHEAHQPCAWVGAAVNAGKPARRASGASGRRCWRCRAVTKVTLSPCSLAPPVLPFRLDLSLDQALHLGVLELAAQPDFPTYTRDSCLPGCPRTSDLGLTGVIVPGRIGTRWRASISPGFPRVSGYPTVRRPAASTPRGAPALPAGKAPRTGVPMARSARVPNSRQRRCRAAPACGGDGSCCEPDIGSSKTAAWSAPA